jgi:hypothetical protein
MQQPSHTAQSDTATSPTASTAIGGSNSRRASGTISNSPATLKANGTARHAYGTSPTVR